MVECSSLNIRRYQNYFVRQNCNSSSYTRVTYGEPQGLEAVCICGFSFSHQGTQRIQHHLVKLRTGLGGLPFEKLNKVCICIQSIIDGRPNDICFQSLLGSRMIFVFAIGHFLVAEKYSYSLTSGNNDLILINFIFQTKFFV